MKRSIAQLASLVLFVSAASAWADDYKIDPVHTSLIYRIKHLQSSYSYGRFNKPSGTFSFDPATPEKAMFDLTVNVSELDSGDAKRDAHLKSPDFFNAKEFPTIHFKSTSVSKAGDSLNVTGELSIHGVTKTVTIPLTFVVRGPGMGDVRAGFEGTAEIKRSDFGMTSLCRQWATTCGSSFRLKAHINRRMRC